ncbi:hypothetical protein QL285_026435 [Trifolium repens]|nr:hypothetical protein QL285_026435 [Trifolium repens]
MEQDPTIRKVHRPSYISNCMMSPPCFPVPNEFQYSKIHYSPIKRKWWWRNLLRKFLRDRKILCRHKQISFQYDPISYSQNFDEGIQLDEEPRRLSNVCQDVRRHLQVFSSIPELEPRSFNFFNH